MEVCKCVLKAICRKRIARELENKFISGSINHSKHYGDNEPFEVCTRKYKGKTYRVFISVKEEL